MTFLTRLEDEPFLYDFLDTMRRLERTLGRVAPASDANATPAGPGADGAQSARPRIGDALTRREEVVRIDGDDFFVSMGQDPYLEFPASNIARVAVDRESTRKRIRIFTKFLGLLGPQGALPLPTTEETFGYMLQKDEAFPRFLDLFNQRFLQLFFRAWADARPIVQNDRPDQDRFRDFVNSTVGVGSPAFAGVEGIPSAISLYAGVVGAQVKSASRLRSAIQGIFGVRAEVEEFIGSWLDFDVGERSLLGARNSGLGTDLLVGASSYSVQDKIRIRIFVADLAEYRRFLPEGDHSAALVDLVFFFIGDEFEWDVELALPARCIEPVRLGQSGALGWTSWASPNYAAEEYRCDARFSPAERAAQKRRQSIDA